MIRIRTSELSITKGVRKAVSDAALLIAGEARRGQGARTEIRSPYNGDIVGTAAQATPEEVEEALEAAAQGAIAMRRLTSGERARILERVALSVEEQMDTLAELIVREQGKTITEARRECARVPELLRNCAGEAARISGEVVPLDQASDGAGKLGLTVRQPVGTVVAITPFNYPLLLVAHKLGPAIAAGNAVILKPATNTPLVGTRLAHLFAEAGMPPGAIQCLTGPGSDVGTALCMDERVRAITFTGSEATGELITARAGVKKLLLELGANCPLIVLKDADLEQAAAATAIGGFSNAGQACISAQRVIVEAPVYGDFLTLLAKHVEGIDTGDPMSPQSMMGPLISAPEAERVSGIIAEAKAAGASVIVGGGYEGATHAPTVVADVPPSTRFYTEELFGPAVGVTRAATADEAFELANASRFGLGAGIFTASINQALRFIREMEAGVLQVNWSPLWRADTMPYGGLKRSGIGKEGPRWAVEELTDSKTVVFHPQMTES